MPIYEYHCASCDVKHERYADSPSMFILCSICDSPARRVPSKFAINKISPTSEKQLLLDNVIYREPGLEKDCSRARESIQKREEDNREKIADQVLKNINDGFYGSETYYEEIPD